MRPFQGGYLFLCSPEKYWQDPDPSWPTDLDLYCLQRQGISRFSRTRFNKSISLPADVLTHCILNRISHTIYWKSPISILGTSGYEI